MLPITSRQTASNLLDRSNKLVKVMVLIADLTRLCECKTCKELLCKELGRNKVEVPTRLWATTTTLTNTVRNSSQPIQAANFITMDMDMDIITTMPSQCLTHSTLFHSNQPKERQAMTSLVSKMSTVDSQVWAVVVTSRITYKPQIA